MSQYISPAGRISSMECKSLSDGSSFIMFGNSLFYSLVLAGTYQVFRQNYAVTIETSSTYQFDRKVTAGGVS